MQVFSHKIFPNQILSAQKLGIDVDLKVDITAIDKQEFEKRLGEVVEFIGDEFTMEEIEKKWCEMTAQPLLNHLAI